MKLKMKQNKQILSDEYKQLKAIYKTRFEFEGRIKKTFLNDTIYMGIFAKTLIQKWGFDKKFLKDAEKKGILYKKHFAPNGIKGTYKVGYLFLETELSQRTKFKRFIKSIWKLFKP